jgi:uncharacterized protein YgbK (DUF1537 family)
MSHFQKRHVHKGDKQDHFSEGYHLLVCGTVAEPTRLQISALREAYPYQVISLTAPLLLDPAQLDDLFLKANRAQRILSRNNLIIRVEPGETTEIPGAKKASRRGAEEIVRALGPFVAEVLRETTPASLFLSGGDTASTVLGAIGAQGIRLQGEIVPGMPEGTLMGGLIDGLLVVTKAGAFGQRETLVALHEYWSKRGKEKSA